MKTIKITIELTESPDVRHELKDQVENLAAEYDAVIQIEEYYQ